MGSTVIKPNLNYLDYKENFQGLSRYWIASKGIVNQAMDSQGRVTWAAPFAQFPVLCTQSAPFSNETYKDTSKKWQVTVNSNNQYLTG